MHICHLQGVITQSARRVLPSGNAKPSTHMAMQALLKVLLRIDYKVQGGFQPYEQS